MRGDMTGAQLADGRGVLLMPSVFVWPDVVSGFARPWQPTVICPARGMGGLHTDELPLPSEALARLLGRQRAGDPGRAREPGVDDRPGPPPRSRPLDRLRPPVGPARGRAARLTTAGPPRVVRANAARRRGGLRRLTCGAVRVGCRRSRGGGGAGPGRAVSRARGAVGVCLHGIAVRGGAIEGRPQGITAGRPHRGRRPGESQTSGSLSSTERRAAARACSSPMSRAVSVSLMTCSSPWARARSTTSSGARCAGGA